jgi:hypothetical protein
MRVVGSGILLTSGISISTALGHLSFLVHENVSTFSHQLKQGIHISFQLGEAVCGVAVMRHPPSSASETFQAVSDHANFKSALFTGIYLKFKVQYKEAFHVCDGCQIES